MNDAPDRIDTITEHFQRETALLRRRTLWLTLLPIVVGAVVVTTAYMGVSDARAKVARADKELEDKRAELAELEREIEERREVFDHFAKQLPSAARERARTMDRGLEALRENRYGEAVEMLKRVVEADPGFAEARFKLGVALAEAGDEAEAQRQVEEAVKIDSRYEMRARDEPRIKKVERPGLIGRAEVDRGASEFDRGPNEVDRGPSEVDRDPNEVDRGPSEVDLIAAGRRAVEGGDLTGAAEVLGEALRISPDNAEVLGLRGRVFYDAGEYGEAEVSLRRAVELDPDFAEGHFYLALSLWQAGAREEAARELEMALELDPRLGERIQDSPAFRRLRSWLRTQ